MGVVNAPKHVLTCQIFIRVLALVYFAAFASLMSQVSALFGENGIAPISLLLENVRQNSASNHFWNLPTGLWLSPSDGFLKFLTGAGALFAVFIFFGKWQRLLLFLTWFFYLSLVNAGPPFMNFQWDVLLLEAGFLAIFVAPKPFWKFSVRAAEPPKALVWLLRWLLFRLMFFSGYVKFASGDVAWADFTALGFHYETQPLPQAVSWFVHQAPLWFHQASCLAMFAIEFGASLLIFGNRFTRQIAFWAFTIFQGIIILTGNYGFFNYLSLALGFWLLDDEFLLRLSPARLSERLLLMHRNADSLRLGKVGLVILGLLVVIPSVSRVVASFKRDLSFPTPILALIETSSRLHLTASYGLFAVMTTERDEIVIEGSFDGESWLEYEFPYKPGDPTRRPAFVAPHQPRLDWQMWFAALSRFEQNPWLKNLFIRILQGKAEVLALFAKNPFPDAPPKYLRAKLYRYRFTTIAEREKTGRWWQRQFVREYAPAMSLAGGR